MSSDKLENRVIEILTNLLSADIFVESSMENVTEWDSFNHVLLMIELQSEFSLSIKQEDYEKLVTVSEIVEYLSDRV